MAGCGRFLTIEKRLFGHLSVRYERAHLTLSVRSDADHYSYAALRHSDK
jgi:hypothetical protein